MTSLAPGFEQIVGLGERLRDGSLDEWERHQLALLVEQVGWSLQVAFHGAGDCARWEPLARTYARCGGDPQ
ncbi:MAG: hypothetical protein LC799_10445 [Actinobacteria bacterium]|nr:hypothetical protein [Actinomycetota bacterium]